MRDKSNETDSVGTDVLKAHMSCPDATAASTKAGPDQFLKGPNALRECLVGLLDATPGVVMVSTREGRLLYINAMGRGMLGVGQRENVLNRNVADFYTPRARRRLLEHALPACDSVGFWHGESALLDAEGHEVPVSQALMAHKVAQQSGKSATVYSSIAWDMRKHKQTECELRHRATHDVLTNLPNRSLLRDRLTQALHTAQRHGRFVAVLFVDLDDFKRINDERGHDAGDRLLAMLAARLLSCVRREDTVARYGGDEFVVLLPDLDEAGGYVRVRNQIRKALEEPFSFDERHVRVAATVGVAVYPDDGEDAAALLQQADSRMYSGKAPADGAGAAAVRRRAAPDPP